VNHKFIKSKEAFCEAEIIVIYSPYEWGQPSCPEDVKAKESLEIKQGYDKALY